MVTGNGVYAFVLFLAFAGFFIESFGGRIRFRHWIIRPGWLAFAIWGLVAAVRAYLLAEG